ncbi:MAG: cobalamin biosynthesis protein CobQ [Deltaproteobacteria bacterium]|nr:cobalamin biosynthesis protein CobQ [Deltaproteobacteria bacterium]
MLKTQYEILVGNYGSGKTEIALNLALDAAAAGSKVALVDLDIVNPYFRSSGKRGVLEEAGVRLVASPFVDSPVDLPLVAAEVAVIFTGKYDFVVVDVGGDPVGATALGRYAAEFAKIAGLASVNFVLNACRPQTMNAPDIRKILELIEDRSRLKIKAIINNTNLAEESSGALLLSGQTLAEQAGLDLDLPVRYITGHASVLDDFDKLTKQNGINVQGELRPIVTRLRPEWFRH